MILPNVRTPSLIRTPRLFGNQEYLQIKVSFTLALNKSQFVCDYSIIRIFSFDSKRVLMLQFVLVIGES